METDRHDLRRRWLQTDSDPYASSDLMYFVGGPPANDGFSILALPTEVNRLDKSRGWDLAPSSLIPFPNP